MAKKTPPKAPEAPAYQCGECGHTQCVTQLRGIKITIGWDRFQTFGVAPAQMCTKCGKLTVATKLEIKQLAGLVSEDDAKKAAKAAGLVGTAENGGGATDQSSTQIQSAIDNLIEMKDRALEQEAAKKKAAKSKRTKAAKTKRAKAAKTKKTKAAKKR